MKILFVELVGRRFVGLKECRKLGFFKIWKNLTLRYERTNYIGKKKKKKEEDLQRVIGL